MWPWKGKKKTRFMMIQRMGPGTGGLMEMMRWVTRTGLAAAIWKVSPDCESFLTPFLPSLLPYYEQSHHNFPSQFEQIVKCQAVGWSQNHLTTISSFPVFIFIFFTIMVNWNKVSEICNDIFFTISYPAHSTPWIAMCGYILAWTYEFYFTFLISFYSL